MRLSIKLGVFSAVDLAMTGNTVIEFKNVWFKYNSSKEYVLKDINVIIRKGESVAIIGVNGSGKTTLLKLINGLIKPNRGVVRVLGMNTKNTPTHKIARHVGFVPQNPYYMVFARTLKEELEITLKTMGYPKDRIHERIELISKKFGIEELLEKSPRKLSYGQLRIIVLAIVLSYDPDVILLDEPTVGYDKGFKHLLSTIISELIRKGKTIVASSQDLDFVSSTFSRVILLHNGRITIDDTPRNVLYNIKALEKSGLLAPPIPSLFTSIEREVAVSTLGNPYKPISVYEAYDLLSRFVKHSFRGRKT